MAVAEMPRPTPKEERRLWTVDEFQRMAALGLFDEDECLELIQGEIYRKMPPNPPHASITDYIALSLQALVASVGACIRVEKPLVLHSSSQPEPDLALVKGKLLDYLDRHPVVADALLIMEVSDSTLGKDKGVKKDDYALSGIPEYWIVNLKARKIEVFRDPQNGKWQTEFTKTQTDDISPLCGPTATIPVKDLLP